MAPYLPWSPWSSDVTYGERSWSSRWNIPLEKASRDHPSFLMWKFMGQKEESMGPSGCGPLWWQERLCMSVGSSRGQLGRRSGLVLAPSLYLQGPQLSGDIMATPAESPLGSDGL